MIIGISTNMILADLPLYIKQCAPKVAPSTMLAIVQTESKGNYLAINLNRKYKLKYQPITKMQAIKWVEYLDKHGYDFDVGLGQVNVRNIRKYGYRPVDMLEPCVNLSVASDILYNSYNKALKTGNKNKALYKALSAYNTGDYYRGFTNGYVRKVLVNGGVLNSNYPSPSRQGK